MSLAAYRQIEAQAAARHLIVLGGFYPGVNDKVPSGYATLLLLGPNEPVFWSAFCQSREYLDDRPDAMDRWSQRVIGEWATERGGQALFPFGGPPYLPFFSWAIRSGRCHPSPVHLLIHDRAGLFVSFRGALALKETIPLPKPPPSPCTACVEKPCLASCPVDALNGTAYDVPACRAFLKASAGADCMIMGCAVRRACPISQNWGRTPEQSAYHMRHFKEG